MVRAMPDGGGALSKDELIQTIQDTLNQCHEMAKSGEKLPKVARASFGGAESGQTLGFHAGAAHDFVVEGMSKLAAGILAFDEGVSKFRKDVQDTDYTLSVPFIRATQGLDADDLFAAGQGCTVGDTPHDYSQNNQCTLPTEDDS